MGQVGTKHVHYDYSSKHLNKNQYKCLRKSFASIAEKKVLTKEKWIELVKGSEDGAEELAAITFDTYDIDGNGLLDEREFLDMSALIIAGAPEEKLKASFQYFDRDRSGNLSKSELRPKLYALVRSRYKERGQQISDTVLKEIYEAVDAVLEEVFDKIDSDGDGTIDLEEYVAGFAERSEVLCFLNQL